MHHPIRRVALGVALTGALVVAVPAAANAALTCTYDAGTKVAQVSDTTSTQRIAFNRFGNLIVVTQVGGAELSFCQSPTGMATVTNTDSILVDGKPQHNFDGYTINEENGVFGPGATLETDGNSEIEFLIREQTPGPGELRVIGTPQADTLRVTGANEVMIGDDDDIDVKIRRNATAPTPLAFPRFTLMGGSGNDFLSGRGGSNQTTRPATHEHFEAFGGIGTDLVVDGLGRDDIVSGNEDNDSLFAVDGRPDAVFGGPGVDDNGSVDAVDQRPLADVEHLFIQPPVGVLKVVKPRVQVQAGAPSRLSTIRWKHPQAWEKLRKLEVRLSQGGDVVGSVLARPKSTRIVAHGLVKTAPKGSGVSHHGKWVKLRLAVRLPQSLAGQALRMDVVGTDRNGHVQFEPSAGVVTVR